jgi:hypothetical protein
MKYEQALTHTETDVLELGDRVTGHLLGECLSAENPDDFGRLLPVLDACFFNEAA